MTRPTVSGARVLVVLAHPDDESLACGGTIALLSRHGAHVRVVCATHGE
ncbi:MAG: PIG-L family deacetylase, partial [Acidobacteria bacterium]|nr:PIG-L family deacetylase [Acidobacteriota bacterium]